MEDQTSKENIPGADIAILKQYIKHAKETTRLSLLGIFIIGIIFFWSNYWNLHPLSGIEIFFLFISLLFFSVAGGYALKLGFSAIHQVAEAEQVLTNRQSIDDWKTLMGKNKLIVRNNTIHTGIAVLSFLIAIILFAIPPADKQGAYRKGNDDGKIAINIIQLNDVYEIAPLDQGRIGGMARVATLKREYEKENPNTIMVMAGDFISPSPFNNVKYDGTKVLGKQMIDVMNAAGFDLAIFGNHEFDFGEFDLQQCIDASSFEWVASNTLNKTPSDEIAFKQRSKDIPPYLIKTFTDKDGTTIRIGFLGITIRDNEPGYVKHELPNEKARVLYNQVKNLCDAVIAITHQSMEDDEKLAQLVPGLTAIIGGHEHNGRNKLVNGVYISKALANAKSAFIIKLAFNRNDEKPVRLTIEEKNLDSTINMDVLTDQIVAKWMNRSTNNFKELKFSPENVIVKAGVSYDGRDETVRKKDGTNLTKAIVAAMHKAYPSATVAVFNAGSIRVDDMIVPPIREYDIIRALPYIDSLKLVEMNGDMLIRLLNTGLNLPKDDGMLLHYTPTLSHDETTKTWKLGDKAIVATTKYKVVLANYLLSGKQKSLEFLKGQFTNITPASPTLAQTDIDHALIEHLK